MYNNRTLYYLKQLGIIPWIPKSTTSKGGHKLMVLASSSMLKSANYLLKQILASLALEKEQMVLLLRDETDNTPLKSLNTQKKEGHFWLIFGNELYSKYKEDVIGKAIVVEDLQSLLENPKHKKQVFLDLYSLKHDFCNSSTYDG